MCVDHVTIPIAVPDGDCTPLYKNVLCVSNYHKMSTDNMVAGSNLVIYYVSEKYRE